MHLILVMLLQISPMSLLQTWVDRATDNLGMKRLTVVESTRIGAYAATDGELVYVHPLFIERKPPQDVIRHIAYHEVCHVYLGHVRRDREWVPVSDRARAVRQDQLDADECARTKFFRGTRRTRHSRAWRDWNWKNPIRRR